MILDSHKTCTWIRESHKVTDAPVIDFILFMYVVTNVSLMTKKLIVIPIQVVISNRVRLRRVCYVVQRIMFDVASDLCQKIEVKDNPNDQ